MRQVNAWRVIFPGARNPGTYSDEVWHVQLRPPSCQIRGGRHKWTGVDIWVNLYPGVLFYFSDSSITRTAKSEKRGFSLNAPKIYLAVGALLWVLFASVSNLQHFTSKNIFSVDPSRLLFCTGVNRKRPLLLMIAT